MEEDLSKFGFYEHWFNWIGACISNRWIVPVINERPVVFFNISMVLR